MKYKDLLIYIVIFLIGYLIGAFVNAQFNPSLWDINNRIAIVVVSTIIFGIAMIVKYIINKI